MSNYFHHSMALFISLLAFASLLPPSTSLQAAVAPLPARSSSSSPSFKITPIYMVGEDGNFYVNMSIGTHHHSPRRLLVDTLGHLIWTNMCNNISSSSFSPLVCSSHMCQAAAAMSTCNAKNGASCQLKYQDTNGSDIQIDLGTDTFTLTSRKHKSPKLALGCANPKPKEDGALGLARGPLSLVSQLHAANTSFSYCLPTFDDPSKTGALWVGWARYKKHPSSKAVVARLVGNAHKPHPYYISLQGISVGGVRLSNIDSSAFAVDDKDGSGGVVVDTGKTMTSLARIAFDSVAKEVKKQINIPTTGASEIGLPLCFTVPSWPFVFPAITFHFGDSNDLELTVGNSYREYVNETTQQPFSCLAMVPAPASDSGMSRLGNIQQQETLVVFNLANKRVEFRTNTECDKM